MIELTKINGETIVVNPDQIEYIEFMPESKLIMVNGKYHVVVETREEIINKTVAFKKECFREAINLGGLA